MYYFCTYFDQNYLPRGLALYRSLREHCPEFKLWVLCLDAETYTVLSQRNLPDMHLITLEEFERDDTELLQAKQNRSVAEYYFTCTPSLPLFILNNVTEVDAITYLDADLYFFSDPKPIFEEIGDNSIAVIEHRFPSCLRDLASSGIFNVAWLYFKRDKEGFSCLALWRDQCNQWCYDRIEDGKFADQKYLDAWPTLFNNLIVLQHKGANLAPWNIENYNITSRNGSIWVDDQPLIFYHFHGIKHVLSKLYDSGLSAYRARLTSTLLNNVYLPYLSCILLFEKKIKSLQSKKPMNTIRLINSTRFEMLKQKSPKLFNILRITKKICVILFTKTYIISPNIDS